MKYLLITYFCATFSAAQGQYMVTWDLVKTNVQINKTGTLGSINNVQVEPGIKVSLTIEVKKDELEELRYAVKGTNGRPEMKALALEFEDNNSALTINIEANANGQKMQIQSNTAVLAYPYTFEAVTKSEGTKSLKLGDVNLIEQSPPILPPVPVFDLLQPVNGETEVVEPVAAACTSMENYNVLIVLDASTGQSARSRLYRKNACGKCQIENWKRNGIKVGDYVKIYLENFNPYLYNVSFEDQQIDASFGDNFPIQKDTAKNKNNGTNAGIPDAASGGTSDIAGMAQAALARIRQYAEAVRQLDNFVELAKTDRTPSSYWLSIQQFRIITNLSALGLNGEGLDTLTNALSAAQKESIAVEYRKAKQFVISKATAQMLTYDWELTMLPIKIRSFDKFEFTVKIKEKSNGNVIATRLYEHLIKGGLKVDQSFGIAVHGIRDQEFGLRSFTGQDSTFVKTTTWKDSLVSIKDAPKREIIEEGSPSSLAFGATTLTHLYLRTSIGNKIRVGIGPEVGVCVDIYPKVATRYLLGGGIQLYDGRHRISLDVGYALGTYQGFGNGQGFKTVLSGQDAQPALVERHGRSLYFGISYNTPLLRKETQTGR